MKRRKIRKSTFKTLGKTPEEMVDLLETWLHERDRAEEQYDDGGGI